MAVCMQIRLSQGVYFSWPSQDTTLLDFTLEKERIDGWVRMTCLPSASQWSPNLILSFLFPERREMFQTQKDGRLFLQFSVTPLRHLRGVYEEFTASDGMEATAINRMYMSPKFMKLLEILKEFGNPQGNWSINETDTLWDEFSTCSPAIQIRI